MAVAIFKQIPRRYLPWKKWYSISTQNATTAGIIVIGDEILKGSVTDSNSRYISKMLYDLGVTVRKIVVVGDCVEDISKEVKVYSSSFDYVITTGGIGPTHDDVTYEGVAQAFNEDLVLNPILEKILTAFFQSANVKNPSLKLAHIPRSARLTFGKDPLDDTTLKYPNVSIKNVFVFPGVPQLLEKSFRALSKVLFVSSNKFYSKTIYLKVPEYMVVSELNLIVQKYPNVMFGSYPELFNEKYKLKITIESTDENLTEDAYNKCLHFFPSDVVVPPNNQIDLS